MPSTQDLVKGIDLTALSVVTGSEINQQIDTGRVAADKGLIIETTDSALDTPVVPSPAVAIIGIIPTWWKRYLWKRVPFDNTGKIKTYQWFELAASDVTYLKWIDTTAGLLNQDDLTTLNNEILSAQTTANSAQTTANLASAQALDAFSIGQDANIALDAFKAFFGTEGQVSWINITGKPENVSGVKYLNAWRSALNISNVAAFADTGWQFLDLTAIVDLFSGSIALAPQLCTVIISAKVETQLVGASAGFAQADVYFSNAASVDPAYLTDARLVTAKVKVTSPGDGIGVGQKEFQVALTGTKGIYYRWVSTGQFNDLQIHVTGFVDDVTKVA